MRCLGIATGFLAWTTLIVPLVAAEPSIWGVQGERLEYRFGDDTDIMAWDVDALIGTDEAKFVLRSEGEFATNDDVFETLENQARVQVPISTFFDVVAGIRLDTPEGPERVHGVLGVHGLGPQWFEVDADLFISDHPSFRLEVEYEALLTNWLILTPSFEFDLPFRDDRELNIGEWGPTLELGLRLSYDLIDRSVSPYVGVHYERVFGDTRDIIRSKGEDDEPVFFVGGLRFMF